MMDSSIVKRTPDKNLQNLTPFRGTAHSMHKKDGQEGKVAKDGKVTYSDLGKTDNEWDSPSKKDAVHYPSLSIPSGKMPELGNRKIGDEITLSVKARITGAHHSRETGSKFELDVEKVAVQK